MAACHGARRSSARRVVSGSARRLRGTGGARTVRSRAGGLPRHARDSPERALKDPLLQSSLTSRFEQLDGLAIGILDLDLTAGWARLHLVSKARAHVFLRHDARREIGDPQVHAI